jgi:hypothetical protein
MDNIAENQMKFNIEKILTRSPRLETVVLVEKFIKEHSGDFKKTDLLNNLPKKMMWGTFNVILKYLYDSGKIGADKNGFILYIWNPNIVKSFASKKRY